MNTTAVFAEILIVGLEAEGWLFLLVLAGSGPGWLDDLSALRGWETLATLLVLATAYVLGIVVDRSADSVFRSAGRSSRLAMVRERAGTLVRRLAHTLFGIDLKEREPLSPPAEFPWMRLVVMNESEGMGKFLDYQRSRLRVARGTVLNLCFLVPSLAAFLLSGLGFGAEWLAAALGPALVVLPVALFVAVRISEAYDRRLSDAYRIVRRNRRERAGTEARVG